jgi:hypothetical protein
MGLVFLYKDEITTAINTFISFITSAAFSKIPIDGSKNYRCVFSIRQRLGLRGYSYRAADGAQLPDYSIPSGFYFDNYEGYPIVITIDDKENITLVSYCSIGILTQYFNSLYQAEFSPERNNTFYFVDKGNWGYPIVRRCQKKELLLSQCTKGMKDVLNDINAFIRAENVYKTSGRHFRRGYILTGPTRTGKSTIGEIVATTHGMPVYLIQLTGDDVDDSRLINLISQVPPKSVIMIEELEKQLTTITSNTNKRISIGGILSSIDGPQRVAHGVIFIITANALPDDIEFVSTLIQPGRIDKHYTLTESVV